MVSGAGFQLRSTCFSTRDVVHARLNFPETPMSLYPFLSLWPAWFTLAIAALIRAAASAAITTKSARRDQR